MSFQQNNDAEKDSDGIASSNVDPLAIDSDDEFSNDASFNASIIEQLDPEDKWIIDDHDEDLDEDVSNIQSSDVIDFLPDASAATDQSATGSVCCIDSMRVSSNCILCAVGSCDEKCRVYTFVPSENKLSLVQTLSDFSDSVVNVVFSFDNKYLAAASYDATVRIYSISLDKIQDLAELVNFSTSSSLKRPEAIPEPTEIATLVQTLEGPTSDIEWIQWHPKGYAIIAGSKDSTVWMWWATSGKVMNVFSAHGAPVSCGTFAYSGKLIVTGESILHMVMLRY